MLAHTQRKDCGGNKELFLTVQWYSFCFQSEIVQTFNNSLLGKVLYIYSTPRICRFFRECICDIHKVETRVVVKWTVSGAIVCDGGIDCMCESREQSSYYYYANYTRQLYGVLRKQINAGSFSVINHDY